MNWYKENQYNFTQGDGVWTVPSEATQVPVGIILYFEIEKYAYNQHLNHSLGALTSSIFTSAVHVLWIYLYLDSYWFFPPNT